MPLTQTPNESEEDSSVVPVAPTNTEDPSRRQRLSTFVGGVVRAISSYSFNCRCALRPVNPPNGEEDSVWNNIDTSCRLLKVISKNQYVTLMVFECASKMLNVSLSPQKPNILFSIICMHAYFLLTSAAQII